eukprot:TRINITY_DN6746_c0_g2_i10.p1 TRINITY_DN6746_c0_g2~~TRINITY_DN6746_c0_g2_i10.p1  ORF type:complete len:183 (+),score=50.51 TRINITY_DN6746_c0_g2_i10:183-731(+)
MYKALALLEVYFNRVVQHVLISFYNVDKTSGDKSVAPYFDSEFAIINELVQEYQQLALNQHKKLGDPGVIAKANDSIKTLAAENEKLRKKCAELAKELESAKESENVVLFPTAVRDQDEHSTEFSKLQSVIEELNEKLVKEKEKNEDILSKAAQREIDNKALLEEIEEIKSISSKYSCNSNR